MSTKIQFLWVITLCRLVDVSNACNALLLGPLDSERGDSTILRKVCDY